VKVSPGAYRTRSDAIFESLHSGHRRARRAAVKGAAAFYAVTDDSTATVGARRRERVNGTLERIEDVRLACHRHRERLVIAVAADFTLRHCALRLWCNGILRDSGQQGRLATCAADHPCTTRQ